MTFRTAVLGVGMVWVAAVAVQPRVVAQEKSVWDGVYTEDQAKRGQEAYASECSACHQPDLGGDGFAPGLSGPEFASAWNDSLGGRPVRPHPPVDAPDQPRGGAARLEGGYHRLHSQVEQDAGRQH